MGYYDYYNYDTYESSSSSEIFLVVTLAVVLLVLAGQWKLFVKAGYSGISSIIPIYNVYLLFKIVYDSGFRTLLLLVPLVNIVILIILFIDLAHCFDKSGGFAAGLIFLPFIFLPILGFSDAVYLGPKQPE